MHIIYAHLLFVIPQARMSYCIPRTGVLNDLIYLHVLTLLKLSVVEKRKKQSSSYKTDSVNTIIK